MSATAEVVVKQAEGINVPTSAITADAVTVERDGKQVRQRVVTGLAGNSSTIVLSGPEGGRNGRAAGGQHDELERDQRDLDRAGSAAPGRRLGGAGGGLGGGAAALRGGGGGAFFRGGG